jgi:hypothetical protein
MMERASSLYLQQLMERAFMVHFPSHCYEVLSAFLIKGSLSLKLRSERLATGVPETTRQLAAYCEQHHGRLT